MEPATGLASSLREPAASGSASAAPSHARLRTGRRPVRLTPRNLIGSSPCGVHIKEKPPLLGASDFNGASDRARTGDPRFTRAVLYQLSYAGGHVCAVLDEPAKSYITGKCRQLQALRCAGAKIVRRGSAESGMPTGRTIQLGAAAKRIDPSEPVPDSFSRTCLLRAKTISHYRFCLAVNGSFRPLTEQGR